MLSLRERYEQSAENMLSNNYSVRFQAEYDQVRYRLMQLEESLSKYDDATIEANEYLTILALQNAAMLSYMSGLEERAEEEGIELSI